MLSRFQFGRLAGDDGRNRGFWTVVVLLLPAVLIPTACLLYFINEAVVSQRVLARQQLDDAYRGQLRLVGESIDAFWEQRARDLDAGSATESPALFFEHCVRDGLADSVICLNADGSPAYPSLAAPPRADPAAADSGWVSARSLEDGGQKSSAAQKYDAIAKSAKDPALAARAAQAAIRCLVASGQREAAIAANEEYFGMPQLAYAADLDGRLISIDEHRLFLDLVLPSDPRYQRRLQQLFGPLQNYDRAIPSAQRLYLMNQLRSLPIDPRYRLFPTYSAERGAERILSDGRAIPGETELRLSGIADAWKLTSPSKRVLAFYTTRSIMDSIHRFMRRPGSSGQLTFEVAMPGGSLPRNVFSIPAGKFLPGWQLGMDTGALLSSGTLAKQHIAAYGWIGFLTIATVCVLAITGAHALRRQMRIAHLKTDLVAAVSHELKTPLASMKLLVESLLSGQDFEPMRTRQYLEMVARENTRLSRLIDNFLTFSRMERNRNRFDFARVQPETVARAAMESVGERYHVALEIAPSLPPVYADENALITVLLNLLDNAYKYTNDDRRIHLGVFASADQVIFAIQDNGIGIAERDCKKIFRRFYQVDRRLARQTGGVGLGLSIVEFIVKAHRGTVSVVSHPGAGSTFTIAIPRASLIVEAAA